MELPLSSIKCKIIFKDHNLFEKVTIFNHPFQKIKQFQYNLSSYLQYDNVFSFVCCVSKLALHVPKHIKLSLTCVTLTLTFWTNEFSLPMPHKGRSPIYTNSMLNVCSSFQKTINKSYL